MNEVINYPHGLVYGWGINDANYAVKTTDKISGSRYVCPFYSKWYSMVERGYSANKKKEAPSVFESSVSQEWKFLSAFTSWMKTQDWKGCVLDKDILYPGNREYSSKTCCFVPANINTILNIPSKSFNLPIGVCKNNPKKSKTDSYCSRVRGPTGDKIYLGSFKTPEEAHKAWQLGKAKLVEQAIIDYMLHPSYRQDVANALYLRVENLRNDAESGKQTFTL